MRSTDQQLQEITRRAALVREKRTLGRLLRADALAACVCFALLIGVSLCLPGLTAGSASVVEQRYGSLLLSAPGLGYVAVGVPAFALGVCVTLLCVHWKKWKGQERP